MKNWRERWRRKKKKKKIRTMQDDEWKRLRKSDGSKKEEHNNHYSFTLVAHFQTKPSEWAMNQITEQKLYLNSSILFFFFISNFYVFGENNKISIIVIFVCDFYEFWSFEIKVIFFWHVIFLYLILINYFRFNILSLILNEFKRYAFYTMIQLETKKLPNN